MKDLDIRVANLMVPAVFAEVLVCGNTEVEDAFAEEGINISEHVDVYKTELDSFAEKEERNNIFYYRFKEFLEINAVFFGEYYPVLSAMTDEQIDTVLEQVKAEREKFRAYQSLQD
ncbi:hypothetical protein KY346_04775 [Candidatus Woesearchaeota archaeon]|nr:hypothetical protein [Candidatus Woesearchaeota archaeon]